MQNLAVITNSRLLTIRPEQVDGGKNAQQVRVPGDGRSLHNWTMEVAGQLRINGLSYKEYLGRLFELPGFDALFPGNENESRGKTQVGEILRIRNEYLRVARELMAGAYVGDIDPDLELRSGENVSRITLARDEPIPEHVIRTYQVWKVIDRRVTKLIRDTRGITEEEARRVVEQEGFSRLLLGTQPARTDEEDQDALDVKSVLRFNRAVDRIRNQP